MFTQFIVTLYKRIFGIAEKFERNALNEIEVLIHKDARHHSPHGFMVATNRALNIKLGTVAFVFSDLVEAPPLTQRVMSDLWAAFHSQGWVPDHLVAYSDLGQMNKEEREELADTFSSAGFTSAAQAEMRISQELNPGRHLDTDAVARAMRSPAVHRQDNRRVGAHETQGPGNLHLTGRATLQTYSPQVAHLLSRYQSRISNVQPDERREFAHIKFEGIVANGVALNQTLELMTDKLELALREIVGSDYDFVAGNSIPKVDLVQH
jgi:hypothetical protein